MIYCVKSENLGGLGGPMGTEYTSTNWREYFSTLKYAKEYAEKDYGNKITWKKEDGHYTSGDLAYVMYEIYPIKVKK